MQIKAYPGLEQAKRHGISIVFPSSRPFCSRFSTPASQLALKTLGSEVQERMGWGTLAVSECQETLPSSPRYPSSATTVTLATIVLYCIFIIYHITYNIY